ncbi:MAG: SUF system Fe-S cluster assembly regulator [Proteobacteria bacterium]|nr:SUF system Fe-S cluster assembly regulator [Pseudomonadota bacterium]
MIRLNKMTDYAVVMLSHMAGDHGKVVTAARIALDSGVPLPSVSKLLKQLGKANILISHRGAGGGYSLGRAAKNISVAEIVTALEGPIALTACIDGADTSCGSLPLCAMSGHWNQVNRAIEGALQGVSLADMMPRPFAFKPASDELRLEIKTGVQQADIKPETQITRAP